jgi:HEAT repeat protein
MSNDSISSTLKALFDAERAVRSSHVALLEEDQSALVDALGAAVEEAVAISDRAESALRLVRVAEILSDVEGAKAVDLLISILGNGEPEARHAAGEALEGVAFDRFKEVALGVERALGQLEPGNAALTELPYMLAQIPEPGVIKLLGKFLKHQDAEAVAAAIEALVECGDPTTVSLLTPLEKDPRSVQIEEDDEARVTIGELAKEARDFLQKL